MPRGAFRLGDIVRVEVPEPATDVGVKEEPVFAGNPATLKLTVAENSPNGAMVTLYVVVERRRTV